MFLGERLVNGLEAMGLQEECTAATEFFSTGFKSLVDATASKTTKCVLLLLLILLSPLLLLAAVGVVFSAALVFLAMLLLVPALCIVVNVIVFLKVVKVSCLD